MKNFVIILFLLIIPRVNAQYFSDDNRFSVVEKNGCTPFNVKVTAPECDGSISCTAVLGNGVFLGFNDGDVLPYPTAGNFKLQIVFGTSGTGSLNLQVFPNIQPTFELYACTGNKVSVKVTDTNYDQYIINYNDASTLVTVPKGSLAKDVHTFVSSGNKTISVHGKNLNSADNCVPAATQTIDVTPTLQPASISQLEVLNTSQIKLDFNSPPVSNQLNTVYKLEIAANSNTSFQQLQTLYNVTTTAISNVKPDDNFYCFRMSTFDACTNSIVTSSYSNLICSANFDFNIQSDVNQLKWVTSSLAGSNVANFSISKNPGTLLTALSSATSLDDKNITCNTNYCYQLTTHYTNGSKSVSLQKCDTSFSNVIPAVVEDISAVVNNTSVALTWIQNPAFTSTEYTINKSTNGNLNFLGNSTAPSYTDLNYLTESLSCYQVSYIDKCLNSSPVSVEACPIRLSSSLLPNNSISLSWSGYTGWKNGVKNYIVQRFTVQGQLLETIDNGIITTLTDESLDPLNQTYLYLITAIANDIGLIESVSNTITITKEPNLFYPSSFTPNGDNLNDTFLVFGQYTSKFDMRIFNRWGQEMYHTADLNQGWDGTYKGNLMPEGTYVFTAKITDLEGRASDRSGTVVLLNKQ